MKDEFIKDYEKRKSIFLFKKQNFFFSKKLKTI